MGELPLHSEGQVRKWRLVAVLKIIDIFASKGVRQPPWDEITRAKGARRVEGEGVIPLKAPRQLVPCSCDLCLLMSLLVSVLCYVIICCCCFYCCCCCADINTGFIACL